MSLKKMFVRKCARCGFTEEVSNEVLPVSWKRVPPPSEIRENIDLRPSCKIDYSDFLYQPTEEKS